MATFTPLRKRNRPPSPSDYSMEDFSDGATDGASECHYGLESAKQLQLPPRELKAFDSSLTMVNLPMAGIAAVSPFFDKGFVSHPSTFNFDDAEYRANNNTLMLSQSSTASSLTFASNNATDSSSFRMDFESIPGNNCQQQPLSGAIFDSGICFITDSNHDTHSSVSMESPMRGCSMNLEPVRKKARLDAFGGSPTVALSIDGVRDTQDGGRPVGQQCCCHVCGRTASESEQNKPAEAGKQMSGHSQNLMSAKPKAPKFHTLLSYFPKSGGSKKTSQSFNPFSDSTCSHPSKIMTSARQKEVSIPITCRYCDKPTCFTCTRPCERCSHNYCTFCSKVDYGGLDEKIFCFDCCDDVERERLCGMPGDVDMMDL
ncbi:hypothetical protein HJC23_009072 [Cyclotella cryptica]|uniref:Uncharacterized protein n=1 Tax=Cyclotella cryptica TaxID=29204 RepID=A0ABD3RAP0_9STRA